MEGEGFETAPLLESYCERVYEIYDALEREEEIDGGKVKKTLRKVLVQVENSIKNDIKARMEVVFLPYKVSMWDSLESVWKTADEDPDCNAYVIPIPYYTKNPDGSFLKEYYEGDLYPDYVRVTRYEVYDFAERKPDIIFIHNPYDNCNYLTSVHPFFYSKNLKRFTEKLVYIPYFKLLIADRFYDRFPVYCGSLTVGKLVIVVHSCFEDGSFLWVSRYFFHDMISQCFAFGNINPGSTKLLVWE